jgi:hypothetical protein
MSTYEAIKLLIEEEVSVDIYGDLYGHERVAEHLAERFDMMQAEIDALRQKLKEQVK